MFLHCWDMHLGSPAKSICFEWRVSWIMTLLHLSLIYKWILFLPLTGLIMTKLAMKNIPIFHKWIFFLWEIGKYKWHTSEIVIGVFNIVLSSGRQEASSLYSEASKVSPCICFTEKYIFLSAKLEGLRYYVLITCPFLT